MSWNVVVPVNEKTNAYLLKRKSTKQGYEYAITHSHKCAKKFFSKELAMEWRDDCGISDALIIECSPHCKRQII